MQLGPWCNMRISQRGLLLAALLVAGLAPAAAGAQHPRLEEVVVTAQKRVEPLQEAPLSVIALDESMLVNQGVATLADLSIQAASLQLYDFPTSSSNIALFLRGFGNPDSQTLTIDNPVGLYIDGVYISRTSGATLNLLDLERVEILRGPQGTLFGRNSSAGAVNFITAKPGAEFRGMVNAGTGNFGRRQAGFSIDAPVAESLRTKLTYDASTVRGWVRNEGPQPAVRDGRPSEDFYANEQHGLRLAVAWDLTDNLTLDYSHDRSEVEGTGPYYQQNPGRRQKRTTHLFLQGGPYRYVLPESSTEQSGHNLTVNWSFGDSLSLKSITGYREMEELAVQNWSDTLFFATDLEWSTKAFSQEVQLLGNAFGEKLEYILGLYYLDEEGAKEEEQYTNAAGGVPIFDALQRPLTAASVLAGGTSLGAHTIDAQSQSKAVFAQAAYTPDVLGARLRITAGVRYSKEKRDAERGVIPSKPSILFPPGRNELDYAQADYTFALDYAFTDLLNGYLRVATGHRAGGSGERTLDFAQTFAEERNVGYEFGLKSELFERRLRINGVLFLTDYDDLLVTLAGRPPLFASYAENVNAGEARVDGVEFDLVGLLGPATRLTINYVYLNTRIKDVVVPNDSFLLGGPPASEQNLRGMDISDATYMAFAPKHAFSVAFDQGWALRNGAGLDFHLNYSWRDAAYSQQGMGLPVPSLGQLGARIALSDWPVGSARLTVAAWGKNLADAQEVIYNLSNFGYQYNRPRTFGLDLKLNF